MLQYWQEQKLLMQVCTFDDNRHQILRCAICDAVRGTSLDYFMGHHAEVSSGTQHEVQDSAAKQALRSRRAGSEGAGNKQKSIIGFFAGSDAAPRGVTPDQSAAAPPASAKGVETHTGKEQPGSSMELEQILGTSHPMLHRAECVKFQGQKDMSSLRNGPA